MDSGFFQRQGNSPTNNIKLLELRYKSYIWRAPVIRPIVRILKKVSNGNH